MGTHEKTLQQVLLGRADANVAFADLRGLLRALVLMNEFAATTTYSPSEASTKS
jgi:hypothetical protein